MKGEGTKRIEGVMPHLYVSALFAR